MTGLQILLITAEGLLLAYLQILVRRRLDKKLQAQRIEWTHPGPDLSSVAQTIHRVREDYLVLAHSRSADSLRRAVLVASARAGLMQLAYFVDREAAQHSVGSEAEKGSPEHASLPGSS